MMSLWRQSSTSDVVDSSRSVMRVCTPYFAIFCICCYQLDSNLANFGATIEVKWYKFWSFLCNSEMVVCVQLASKVLQGSVEMLFK